MTMVMCPSCGHDDQVQKVSAIHANGTHRGTAMVGWDIASVKSQSALARRLSPPRKQGWHWFAWLITLIFVADGLLTLAMTSTANQPGLGLTASDVTGMRGMSIALLAIGGVPILFHLLSDGRRQREWQSKMSQWGQSWYCHRCNVVFAPTATPAAEVASDSSHGMW